MLRQISIGSTVMAVSSTLHIAVLVITIEYLPGLANIVDDRGWALIIAAFAAILLGHTLQVWVWAISVKIIAKINSLEDAVYFALVTSTTLGYGDVVLQRKWRLFGAIAAVNGLLTFGLSTAFLLEVFAKIYGS
ncbi:MAG: ion channel [Pikeienuella sp.]